MNNTPRTHIPSVETYTHLFPIICMCLYTFLCYWHASHPYVNMAMSGYLAVSGTCCRMYLHMLLLSQMLCSLQHMFSSLLYHVRLNEERVFVLKSKHVWSDKHVYCHGNCVFVVVLSAFNKYVYHHSLEYSIHRTTLFHHVISTYTFFVMRQKMQLLWGKWREYIVCVIWGLKWLGQSTIYNARTCISLLWYIFILLGFGRIWLYKNICTNIG